MRSKSTPQRSDDDATPGNSRSRPAKRKTPLVKTEECDAEEDESISKSPAESHTASADKEPDELTSVSPAKRTKQSNGKDSAEADGSAKTLKKSHRPYRWRTWEKEVFYEALKKDDKYLGKYPERDVELCEEILKQYPVNHRGFKMEDVQRLFTMYTQRARQHVSATFKPIDKWLELMDALTNGDKTLGQVLSLVMMTAKQEPTNDLPIPMSFNPSLPQPDYASLYNYFACAFSDKPLPELSPIDSLVVEDFMQSLCFQIECLNDYELRRSLRKAYLHMAQEPSEDAEADQDDMKAHLSRNASVLNPLGLNALKIVPVVPK